MISRLYAVTVINILTLTLQIQFQFRLQDARGKCTPLKTKHYKVLLP